MDKAHDLWFANFWRFRMRLYDHLDSRYGGKIPFRFRIVGAVHYFASCFWAHHYSRRPRSL